MTLTEKYLELELTEQESWRSNFESLIIESYGNSIDESATSIIKSETVKENDYYVLRKEVHDISEYGEEGETMEMESCYSVIDDSYIGDIKTAKFLEKKGIRAQAIEGHKVASIGFSEKDGKVYGWSHRAISGFKKGDIITKNSIAFEFKNKEFTIESEKEAWDVATFFAKSVS